MKRKTRLQFHNFKKKKESNSSICNVLKIMTGKILSNVSFILICENIEKQMYLNKKNTGKTKWFLCFLSHQILFFTRHNEPVTDY